MADVTLKVRVEGCDDTTYVEFEGTEEEAATVLRLAQLVNEKSEGGCEPSISLQRDGEYIAMWETREEDRTDA